MKIVTVITVAALALLSSGSNMLAQTINTLATFTGPNGDTPYSGLVADTAGNLYGTTFYGGDYGLGTIFRIDGTTHALTTLLSFSGDNGANPIDGFGPLILDPSGVLYGTTEGGAANAAGTVFQFNVATRALTTLATFDGPTTGESPYAGLTRDASGNLYGSTSRGGPNVGGTVFKIDATTHAFSLLASFNSFAGQVGVQPNPPVMDANGNLWGTTATYNDTTEGSIYEIDGVTHSVTIVTTFTGPDGVIPYTLIPGPNGKLYGTTREGGNGAAGTVFLFDTRTKILTTLASFNGDNGAQPGPLLLGSDGDLYGAALYGGAGSLGVIFQLNPTTDALASLASFDGNNGANPWGSVAEGADGNLYGTTTGGGLGAYGYGTVFEVAAPEPATLVVAAFAMLILRRRRRVNQQTMLERRLSPLPT